MQSYCYALAGVRLVPKEKQVHADIPLFIFMVLFFLYVGILLWIGSDMIKHDKSGDKREY